MANDDDDLEDLGDVEEDCRCSPRERYRCVVCWRAVCWCLGADDEAERGIKACVDQAVYAEPGHVSDGGLCDDCWAALGAGESLAVSWGTSADALVRYEDEDDDQGDEDDDQGDEDAGDPDDDAPDRVEPRARSGFVEDRRDG